MKRFLFVAACVAGLALSLYASLTEGNSKEVPEPYKGRIIQLRADSIAMQHKCADLQKEIAEMQAQQNWDAQQMNVASGEALNAIGRDARDWQVNVSTLKIESRSHH
jgi:hypothetical protein